MFNAVEEIQKQIAQRKIPLQTLLIAPFVLQIVLAVGITGWLSLRNAHSAVATLAAQLEAEVSEHIGQEIQTVFDTPQTVHDIIEVSINNGSLNTNDLSVVQSHLYDAVQTGLVSDLLFANVAGDTVSIRKTVEGESILRVKDARTQGYRNKYRMNDEGDRKELLHASRYDTLSRPWFQAAVTAGQPTWSSIYPSSDRRSSELSAVRPLYNKSNELIGVLGSQLTLDNISDLLRNLEISHSGEAFIIERSGELVASSTTAKLFLQDRYQGAAVRVLAEQSKNPLINATTRFLTKEFDSLKNIEQAHSLSLALDGTQQLIHVSPFNDGRGIDWLVVVSVPEDDFMAQIKANTRMTVWLCLASFGLAIFLGIYTSRWIARPVLRLSLAAKAIAAGEFSQAMKEPFIKEIHILSQAFSHMGAQLQSSFSQLDATNKDLENRVEARTATLSHRNQQIADAMKHLKTTQRQMVAQEKLASLGALTAGIAHEIKNPLNFVNNFAGLSVELTDELTEEITAHSHTLEPEFVEEITEIASLLKENVLKIERHGRRADKIVSNMLMHSRNGKVEWQELNINELIKEAVNLAYHGLRAKQSAFNLEFDHDYDSDVGLICGCPQDLNRVFLNIANNACYATYQRQIQEGKSYIPHLKVRTRLKTEAKEKTVEVKIRDNGTGMPPQIKEKIFDQFFTTKPAGEGTGLGLSLSYDIIVQQHRGKMSVESEPGLYTEFTLTLPTAKATQPKRHSIEEQLCAL